MTDRERSLGRDGSSPGVAGGRRARSIVHPQRLAWDSARAFVALADTDREYFWLCARLRELLGAEYESALSDTRTRLLRRVRGNATGVEAGLWRARIEDLLAERPELSLALRYLVDDASARAAEPYAAIG
jgi:hypothetical protein